MIKLRYLLIVLFLFCCNCLFAQSVPAWGGGADQSDQSFGFTFSYISSYYKIDKNADWRKPFIDNEGTKVTDSLRSINSPNAQGFAVGFLSRYNITDHLEARIAPSLIFADRSLNYIYNTSSLNTIKSVQSTMIDIPISLKLKSDRLGDFRAYVMGGVKYSQNIGSRSNPNANVAQLDKVIRNVSGFASYEVGIGCDIYFEFFKLSPEIKLSNSFGDVLLHENSAFSNPINRLSLHTLMFTLYFE
ncbi:outer membrane beta-barrel protein [Mucilaginibacter sp.]|uniref:type IX secretion/gliding motility protein PorT/SprT n=1 Tax=Mucilaginibacter sp. TaxID=1882438 RepID=UPI002626EE17|nr:outer membrane beta-barrel protein [Mucilaginibacter sp.]MDB4926226.1 hypothetical protein [Mucilaginibacter sp.]